MSCLLLVVKLYLHSSRKTGFLFRAKYSSGLRTSVDPVKATLSTFMWLAMAAPAVGPYPGMMFSTPGGKPAWNRQQGIA